jgi:Leu/Phe-tRNA-protein transferase
MPVTMKKPTFPIKVDKAFADLLNWSGQGCTATGREATKLLKPLTDAELIELHTKFGEHYAGHAYNVELELDNGLEDGGLSGDDDAAGAVEDMHDALRARSLISYVHYKRAEKANATSLKLRVVK